jgi:hypothetical protein
LTREQVFQGGAEQDLVEFLAEDVRCGSQGVEIEVFGIPSTGEPGTEIDSAFDDPLSSIHPRLHHPEETQMKAFDVLRKRSHQLIFV